MQARLNIHSNCSFIAEGKAKRVIFTWTIILLEKDIHKQLFLAAGERF